MPFEISQVWVRFLLALVGLILAFGAALFSTVARESGSLWATLVFSSVALALAAIVGLTTVPYLARRVAGDRVRDAFDYDVTRVGIIYVLTILLIGIAALNTGNNLLYVIVAAMLAAILVSGVASAVVLRDLELDIAFARSGLRRTSGAGKNRGPEPPALAGIVFDQRGPAQGGDLEPLAMGAGNLWLSRPAVLPPISG